MHTLLRSSVRPVANAPAGFWGVYSLVRGRGVGGLVVATVTVVDAGDATGVVVAGEVLGVGCVVKK